MSKHKNETLKMFRSCCKSIRINFSGTNVNSAVSAPSLISKDSFLAIFAQNFVEP